MTFLKAVQAGTMAGLMALACALPSAATEPASPEKVTHFEALNMSNGLAKTPPMGWSSWNGFGVEINEQLVIETIDAMVKNGMRDAGYVYVNLDDGWQRYKGSRADHPLEYDPEKFPRGIKYLADYAHKNGMKLGIYSGPGKDTCAGYTGSAGHEAEDADMFASWGIDHLKYDACCSHVKEPADVVRRDFLKMSKALISEKRDIVYHTCHCGWTNIWEWAGDIGANHWRIGQDISDDFDYPENREQYYFDVLDMIDRGVELSRYAKPGQWNDFDMLIVGLDGKSKELVGAGASNVEYRTHFSLWAMLASPLLVGSDVRNLDPYTLETLTNAEVIAISQDPLGLQAEKVRDEGDYEIYARELSDGSWAVALLNRNGTTADMTINWKRDLGLPWAKAAIRDLWDHEDKGTYDIPYTVEVIGHEAKVLRISKPAE
ncbi:glycoside hydrolase family 27 protein [Pseudokordiimonas caeni]|uniref:glycoside hydrolase family 27 protein n=1 Tax=Pseudokordiimonas caeni TaxID=2997908 RepID=UPI002810A8F0|nr:glycoside hydrolase family 27 protein [Pseudokordiimonas caeni]